MDEYSPVEPGNIYSAKRAAVKRLRKFGLRNEQKARGVANRKTTFDAMEKSGPVAKHRGARGAL